MRHVLTPKRFKKEAVSNLHLRQPLFVRHDIQVSLFFKAYEHTADLGIKAAKASELMYIHLYASYSFEDHFFKLQRGRCAAWRIAKGVGLTLFQIL